MDLDKIKINETHICVLKKKDDINEVLVDFLELKFPFDSQLSELKNMSENGNRNILELLDFVENSKLNDLMKSFDYCKSLEGAFQSCPQILRISYGEYRKLIDEYDEQIRNAKDEESKNKAQVSKQNFINNKRTSFYRRVEEHKIPYLLECKYRELDKDKSILAFSHRRIRATASKFSHYK